MVLNVSRSNMFIKSVAEMKRLICISGNTKKDRIKNIYIKDATSTTILIDCSTEISESAMNPQ